MLATLIEIRHGYAVLAARTGYYNRPSGRRVLRQYRLMLWVLGLPIPDWAKR